MVWGSVDTNLKHSKAYDSLVAWYADKICLVAESASSVQLANDTIVINNRRSPACSNAPSMGQHAGTIDFLVESLGRYRVDPPPVVASAAAGSAIEYEPVLEPSTCALIGVKVVFCPQLADQRAELRVDRPPVYLIGAAASWIPRSVAISADNRAMYKAGLDTTVAIVNRNNVNDTARAITIESGPPSFAVAAYMGAHLAEYLKVPPKVQCPLAPRTPGNRGAGR